MLEPAAVDDCGLVQESLAGRTFLPVDPAAPAHRALFRNQRERGEDANLVRRVHLRAHDHRQKGASFTGLALHMGTDSFRVYF